MGASSIVGTVLSLFEEGASTRKFVLMKRNLLLLLSLSQEKCGGYMVYFGLNI